MTGPLAARMGLWTGEGVLGGEHYLNQPLNRCARLMAAGHGGQALVSGATELLVRDDLPEGCGLVDLGEHRLRDLARPVRIFQLTGPGLRAEFPPLRTLEAFAGNLPVQLSSFVGRADELAGLAAAVRASPLVTVTGPGGVGKTRLAVQAAADQLPSFADGAWLCELAAAGDGETMAQAVAAALRVRSAARPVHGGQRGGVLADPQRAAAGAGQLRAPAGRGGGAGRGHPARLPGGADPGHEPAGAGRGRGAGLRAAAAAAAAPGRGHGGRGGSDAVSLFVQRAAAARGEFALSPGERGRGRRDLPAAGRDPAGDRAGRRPGGGAEPGRDRRAAR